jgi:hypothetical protein
VGVSEMVHTDKLATSILARKIIDGIGGTPFPDKPISMGYTVVIDHF